MNSIRRGKILFVDDQPETIRSFVDYLRQEGFTNVAIMSEVESLRSIEEHTPDLIFLDLRGIATTIDPEREGVSAITYVKNKRPWIPVVVLSGSTFTVEKSPEIARADQCLGKGSVNFNELRQITEEHLSRSLAPEYRNALILRRIWEEVDNLQLGPIGRLRLRRIVERATSHEGDPTYQWDKIVKRARGLLQGSSQVATLISLFV